MAERGARAVLKQRSRKRNEKEMSLQTRLQFENPLHQTVLPVIVHL